MTILDKIVAYKKQEVEALKQQVSLEEVITKCDGLPSVPQLRDFLVNPNKNGIIAEFKRQSPSKGIINKSGATPEEVAKAYEEAGVSAMSVLTDKPSFGGEDADLIAARAANSIPILRKDFTVDAYQIYEAKAIGASAILLIASVLTKEEVAEFAKIARSIGLDVLFEVHNREELEKYHESIGAVGVNNRNLATFEVNVQNSIDLLQYFPNDVVKVAESGISSVETINMLKAEGFNGFLIGENFMKTVNPGEACKKFCENL